MARVQSLSLSLFLSVFRSSSSLTIRHQQRVNEGKTVAVVHIYTLAAARAQLEENVCAVICGSASGKCRTGSAGIVM